MGPFRTKMTPFDLLAQTIDSSGFKWLKHKYLSLSTVFSMS
jgi:hypothetical protein